TGNVTRLPENSLWHSLGVPEGQRAEPMSLSSVRGVACVPTYQRHTVAHGAEVVAPVGIATPRRHYSSTATPPRERRRRVPVLPDGRRLRNPARAGSTPPEGASSSVGDSSSLGFSSSPVVSSAVTSAGFFSPSDSETSSTSSAVSASGSSSAFL